MKIAELKRQLNAMDKAELISILCKFYKASKQCQAILDVEVCGASAEAPLIESCRKKIHAAFFGRQLSLKNARAVISDFRKASQNKESIADLMLYYVECGVEFTNLYGDIDERFYSSLESMFADFVMILNSMEKATWSRRAIDTLLSNEKYRGNSIASTARMSNDPRSKPRDRYLF